MRFTGSLLAGFLTGTLLLACTPREKPQAAPAPVANEAPGAPTCGADKVRGYLGAAPSTDTIAKIQGKSGARTIRVLGPGDAMTMDYRLDRLTIEVGQDGRIKALRCV